MADGFLRSGRVADAETRDPLGETIVEVPELGIRVISDESGRVELGRLPAGLYRIRAERLGYEILEGELEVPWSAEFLILLDRATIDDPLAPGRIFGRVTEEGGSRGLADVDITVLSPTPVRRLSDRQGRFDLTDLEPGLVEVRFARLGYASRTTTLIVRPGRTVEVYASMSAEPIELEPVEVTVRSRYLERNGFYRRARTAWGRQFTRRDLDAINAMFVSDLVWRVPGVSLRRTWTGVQAVSRRSASLSRGPCRLQTYLDGMPLFDSDLDIITPEDLEAVEFYHGPGTPIQYSHHPCGVVLLWTRRGG